MWISTENSVKIRRFIDFSQRWEYSKNRITRKLGEHLRKYWTAISTLFGLIGNVCRNLQYWRSNQQTQIAEPTVHIPHKWRQINS